MPMPKRRIFRTEPRIPGGRTRLTKIQQSARANYVIDDALRHKAISKVCAEFFRDEIKSFLRGPFFTRTVSYEDVEKGVNTSLFIQGKKIELVVVPLHSKK